MPSNEIEARARRLERLLEEETGDLGIWVHAVPVTTRPGRVRITVGWSTPTPEVFRLSADVAADAVDGSVREVAAAMLAVEQESRR